MPHRLTAPVIVTLWLTLAMPALADCPALPQRITYDSGAMIEVLSREGELIRYRQTVLESGAVTEMQVHAGLVTVSALRKGEGAKFDWKTPLPDRADLKPGAQFTASAMLATPGIMPPRPFTSQITVLAEVEIEVAGCRYPVTKIEIRNTEAGRALGVNTKWLHLPSMLALKSEISGLTESRSQSVIAID